VDEKTASKKKSQGLDLPSEHCFSKALTLVAKLKPAKKIEGVSCASSVKLRKKLLYNPGSEHNLKGEQQNQYDHSKSLARLVCLGTLKHCTTSSWVQGNTSQSVVEGLNPSASFLC